MKNYEGLFILKPDLEKEALNDAHQKIKDNIKKYNGEVKQAEEWGRRPLAYKIGRNREGIYYLVKFNIEPQQIKQLNLDFKLNESVIRTMFTAQS